MLMEGDVDRCRPTPKKLLVRESVCGSIPPPSAFLLVPEVHRMIAHAKSSTKQRDVGARWTPRLAEMGWTPISSYFLNNYHRLDITSNQAMVIVHLIAYKWDVSAPYPSLTTIAKKMGVTSTSVRSHVRALEKKQLVLRESKPGSTNRFHLDGLFSQLERLLEVDAEKLSETRDGIHDVAELQRYVR